MRGDLVANLLGRLLAVRSESGRVGVRVAEDGQAVLVPEHQIRVVGGHVAHAVVRMAS